MLLSSQIIYSDELDSKIMEYSRDMMNGTKDDELKVHLYNSGDISVHDAILTMIELKTKLKDYDSIYYLASTYIDVFDSNDKVFKSIMEYSKNFYNYSTAIKSINDKYINIEAIYNSQYDYIDRKFYITQVLGYVDDLSGVLNEISDAMKDENLEYYIAYDTVSNEYFGDTPGDIPYIIESDKKLSQAGVYEMNVINAGTNTIVQNNGFEKEVTVYKEVSEDYYSDLDKAYNNYSLMKNEIEVNLQEIQKLIDPKYVEEDTDEKPVQNIKGDGETTKIYTQESETILEGKDSNEVLIDSSSDKIADYLGEWYITEIGKPELDDEGYVESPGVEVYINKENENYKIEVFGAYSGGACPDVSGILSQDGEYWYAYYDEDGWGNTGEIILSIENGVPYITVTAEGGDLDFGLNLTDLPCTRVDK
jgi:hypothetical protein